MGNTGADFHKASSLLNRKKNLYIFCVVWKSLLSLTHSMCFMAQPRIRIWRKKRKKKSWTQETAQKFTRSRKASSTTMAGTHRWTRTFGFGCKKRDSARLESKLKSVRSEFSRRALCQLKPTDKTFCVFFVVFWTRFLMLQRYSRVTRWKKISRYKLTRAMTSELSCK